jgi:hypothetical protein
VPEDGINVKNGLKFLLSDNAVILRNLLEKEVDTSVDVLSRQIFRCGVSKALVALTQPRPPSIPFHSLKMSSHPLWPLMKFHCLCCCLAMAKMDLGTDRRLVSRQQMQFRLDQNNHRQMKESSGLFLAYQGIGVLALPAFISTSNNILTIF